jgi:hypothetical protein
LATMMERITAAEQQAAQAKRLAAEKARECIDSARTEAERSEESTRMNIREKLAAAQSSAEREGEGLFDSTVAESARKDDELKASAAGKLDAAAEYIAGKAGLA